MANQGTQAAVTDAVSYDVDAFQHVQDSIGDFGTQTAIYYGPW